MQIVAIQNFLKCKQDHYMNGVAQKPWSTALYLCNAPPITITHRYVHTPNKIFAMKVNKVGSNLCDPAL